MIFLLDILGSTIAASLVLLTLIQFNFTTSDIRNEFQSSNTVQSGTKDLAEVFEFDFYKAGFRVTHKDVFIDNQVCYTVNYNSTQNYDYYCLTHLVILSINILWINSFFPFSNLVSFIALPL